MSGEVDPKPPLRSLEEIRIIVQTSPNYEKDLTLEELQRFHDSIRRALDQESPADLSFPPLPNVPAAAPGPSPPTESAPETPADKRVPLDVANF